jgi:hypothetical protein
MQMVRVFKQIGWTLAPLALIGGLGLAFVFPYVSVPLLIAAVVGALYWRARRKA